jgi:hypothetical protein
VAHHVMPWSLGGRTDLNKTALPPVRQARQARMD